MSRVSALLVSWGIKRRERVCLLLNPSDVYVTVIHSLTRIGAVIVPLNVRQSPSELAWQINHCKPSLALYDSDLSNIKKRIEEESEDGRFEWKCSSDLRGDTSLRPIRGKMMVTSSLHSIIYTSGSTGTPKGVEITLSNLLWNAISFGVRHGTSPSDKWLLVMPLFHVGGYAIIFRSVLLGSGIVLHPRFEATSVSNSLDNDGITLTSLVPTMLKELLEIHSRPFPGSLRLVFLGGAHPSSFLLAAIRKRGIPVVLAYGMTETCSQVAISSSSQSGEPSYLAMFPNVIAIRNAHGLVHRVRQVGEVIVRGPTICKGYWGNFRATSNAFKGEWFHTGDVGYLDADGGVIVLGRKEDMIISGGENIYPIEVESSLLEHEAIEDAVVIGRRDEEWGQRVEAVVKIKEGFRAPTQFELRGFLAKRIGGYKIPKAYHFWRLFPKTQTGKTKREAIREIVEGGEEWQAH